MREEEEKNKHKIHNLRVKIFTQSESLTTRRSIGYAIIGNGNKLLKKMESKTTVMILTPAKNARRETPKKVYQRTPQARRRIGKPRPNGREGFFSKMINGELHEEDWEEPEQLVDVGELFNSKIIIYTIPELISF